MNMIRTVQNYHIETVIATVYYIFKKEVKYDG